MCVCVCVCVNVCVRVCIRAYLYASIRDKSVHEILRYNVGNSLSNVQIGFISRDLLRSILFAITSFDSFQFSTLVCKHL